jgi:hypothetical protein
METYDFELLQEYYLAFGRPTKYDPKFCSMLLDHMTSGLSYESFAGVISVHRDTLYNWEKEYSDFFDAKRRGSAKNLLYWEKEGQKGLWDETEYNDQGKPIHKKTLNSTVWIFNMKNRHKWRDRQDVDITTTDTQLEEKEKLAKLSMQELKQLVKDQLKDDK